THRDQRSEPRPEAGGRASVAHIAGAGPVDTDDAIGSRGRLCRSIFISSYATFQCLKASLLPHQSDWRQHALLGATGDVRVMSYKWITERLYHNTAMALAQYERGDEGLVSLVECRDDAMAYVVIRDPRVCSATLEDVTEAQRRIYCKLPPSNRLDHEFLEAAFGTNADIVHVFVGEGEPSGVSRLFVDETRSVLVTTHVTVDASTTGAHLSANGNTLEGWIVNDRLSETLTRVREYWVMGFPTLASREAYAAAMHVDESTLQTKTDDQVYRAYMWHMRQATAAQMRHCRANFYETLAQVQHERRANARMMEKGARA
ncbi:hypothetical protein As57867_002038, partial [Aphanomyces stellatus]